jgi:hypothetical protein
VSAACVWLSWFLHTKHSFNPQHHQTPSESFRLERGQGEGGIQPIFFVLLMSLAQTGKDCVACAAASIECAIRPCFCINSDLQLLMARLRLGLLAVLTP